MTGLHSGSTSKMIVLAPLLLILLMANSPHHVHASPRGRQHRQLRQDGNGRQLMANAPNPEAPSPGKMAMSKDKGDGKVAKDGRKSPGNIFGRDEPKESKGTFMMISPSSPGTMGKGKGKGKGKDKDKGQYVETPSKSSTYTEKKSKSSSKGMSIHKISRRAAVDYYAQENQRTPAEEKASKETLDESPVQVVSSQSKVPEGDESSSWLGLPGVTATVAQSSIALPITKQQVGTIDCTLPDTGFFGTPTSDLVIVPYLFQATLVSNTPLAIINRRIAPNLDRGMVEGILPNFFPCANTGRRRLQTSGITGISAQGADIPLMGGLPCVGTQTNGDCLIFLGEMSVFVDGLTEQEAIEVIQGAIQVFIASGGPQSISPFVLNSAYVTDDLQTLAPAPTRAPTRAPTQTTGNTFSPTTFPPSSFPTPTPGPSTGFPTRTPGVGTTPQPTFAGVPQPTLTTPAPVPSAGPPSLTLSPFTPTTQDSPSIAPFTRPTFPSSAGGNTFTPTEAPVGAPPTPTEDGGGGGGGNLTRSSESGIEKMDWWAWVLVGLAAVMALLCGMTYLNGGGGAKRTRPIAKKSSGPEAPDDDYQPPGVDDDYQPPDLGAFNIEPTREPSPTNEEEFYDDEEGEEEYEEEFAGDDEYGDEGVEYEEGDEFEGGEYGDEYGDEENEGEFEEESYYEEETEEGSATPSFTNF